ncbi:MAG: glutamate--tRNA ligase [Pseudomonadota bacterium]
MSLVTRFPPSPTGMMHIGNARTALFNYLLARRHGGKFLIRIEDTDRERYSDEAVQVIKDSLDWLELDYDNTPESQFANKQRHIDVANELLKESKAYKCYCTAEELTEMREEAKKVGRPTAYDRRWRDKDESEAPEERPFVIRIKADLEGSCFIDDEVQGHVEIQNDHIDDFVLLRSDGTPTYMLAVVVDDHDMGITHVMRGDDHLNNTFRQNVIYKAMGWEQPTYAHLPLILGPDGSKLSKRHGSVGVGEFKEQGYLSEAVCNYLLRLGWAHGDEELINRERAIELFGFDGMNKSAARFDYEKLESLNAHYMKEADNDRLLDLVLPFLKSEHGIDPDETGLERMRQGMDELKDRSKTLIELAQESVFLVSDVTSYSDKAIKQLNADSLPVLSALNDNFKSLDEFSAEKIETLCRDLAKEKVDGKLGKVMMPLRAALTGTDKSPSLFAAAAILGQNDVVKRLDNAIQFIESN